MHIRPEVPADAAAIRAVNQAAFGQTDEAGLIDRLRAGGDVVLSLVAEEKAGILLGHILFSRLLTPLPLRLAALAPMAVSPSRQREGIGSALVAAGLDRCRARGIDAVAVLGHETYYPKFGFSAALGQKLDGPFSGPAFMALELAPRCLAEGAIPIRYAPAFGLDV